MELHQQNFVYSTIVAWDVELAGCEVNVVVTMPYSLHSYPILHFYSIQSNTARRLNIYETNETWRPSQNMTSK